MNLPSIPSLSSNTTWKPPILRLKIAKNCRYNFFHMAARHCYEMSKLKERHLQLHSLVLMRQLVLPPPIIMGCHFGFRPTRCVCNLPIKPKVLRPRLAFFPVCYQSIIQLIKINLSPINISLSKSMDWSFMSTECPTTSCVVKDLLPTKLFPLW